KAMVPTMQQRRAVRLAVAAGMKPGQVAAVVGLDPKTVAKRFKHELETGAAQSNAKVVSKLYQKCMKGDTVALLFWCKTRLGWNEKQQIEHTGANGGPIAYEAVEAEAAAFTSRIAQM